MSYGLEVYTPSGVRRIHPGTWASKFHSSHSRNISADSSVDVYISGLDPNTWGVFITSIESASRDARLRVYSGRVNLTTEYYEATFNFVVWR